MDRNVLKEYRDEHPVSSTSRQSEHELLPTDGRQPAPNRIFAAYRIAPLHLPWSSAPGATSPIFGYRSGSRPTISERLERNVDALPRSCRRFGVLDYRYANGPWRTDANCYRRRGKKWQKAHRCAFGGLYETKTAAGVSNWTVDPAKGS